MWAEADYSSDHSHADFFPKGRHTVKSFLQMLNGGRMLEISTVDDLGDVLIKIGDSKMIITSSEAKELPELLNEFIAATQSTVQLHGMDG